MLVNWPISKRMIRKNFRTNKCFWLTKDKSRIKVNNTSEIRKVCCCLRINGLMQRVADILLKKKIILRNSENVFRFSDVRDVEGLITNWNCCKDSTSLVSIPQKKNYVSLKVTIIPQRSHCCCLNFRRLGVTDAFIHNSHEWLFFLHSFSLNSNVLFFIKHCLINGWTFYEWTSFFTIQ